MERFESPLPICLLVGCSQTTVCCMVRWRVEARRVLPTAAKLVVSSASVEGARIAAPTPWIARAAISEYGQRTRSRSRSPVIPRERRRLGEDPDHHDLGRRGDATR
jgi:hypothetical protein